MKTMVIVLNNFQPINLVGYWYNLYDFGITRFAQTLTQVKLKNHIETCLI